MTAKRFRRFPIPDPQPGEPMSQINPTNQDITDAEQALAEAERTLIGAQTLLSQGRPGSGLALAAAQANLDTARQTLDDLRTRREQLREVEAEAAFVALERKHAKDLVRRADELETSQGRVTAAIAAAQEALVTLLDVTTDHNTLIHQNAAEVAALGLAPYREGHSSADPGKGLVSLRGEAWQPARADLVFGQVVERVRLARLNPRDYYLIHQQGRGHAAAGIAARVVGRVAPPERVDYVNRFPRLDPAPIESPVVFRSEYERQEAMRANEQMYQNH
jgi:hypothetical protein